ncbi:hypothetical protein WN48_07375 [Eufriesea mexicana]|uniref:Uncharacterized protein n=1 Tax=Eufriesea mexicana TaxID=516756 RepID=A0A310SRT5_9HYME|nr:hypothetical protein WN48_07375 [Eufriesea mexicana]
MGSQIRGPLKMTQKQKESCQLAHINHVSFLNFHRRTGKIRTGRNVQFLIVQTWNMDVEELELSGGRHVL